MFVALHGHEHPDVSAIHSNIGGVYRQQGRYEEALVQYGKALEIDTRVHGSSHPSVANTKYNTALVHRKRGDREVAKQLFLECEGIYAKVFGPDHSKTTRAAQLARDCA